MVSLGGERASASMIFNIREAADLGEGHKLLLSITLHTAKTQYRKFETNIPRKGIARPQSQFPHSYVWEQFMFTDT